MPLNSIHFNEKAIAAGMFALRIAVGTLRYRAPPA